MTHIPVTFPAGEAGRKKFTISLGHRAEEVSTANNSRELRVEVHRETARVLYLDAGPRWQAQYLREAWTRDNAIQLQELFTTPPPDVRLPSGYPRDRDGLFTYDVVALGDVLPSAFAQEEIALLRDYVTQRGGTCIPALR